MLGISERRKPAIEQRRASDPSVVPGIYTPRPSYRHIRFIERYEDETAFEAHTQTAHFGRFEERLPDLLAGEPEVLRFDVDGVTELEL